MAVFTISATVNEQDISLDFNGAKLVSGSKDIYQIQFTFSEGWDSYTKKVVFENPTPKRVVIEILLSGTNICTIPIRSLANPTFLRVGVYGVGTNDEVMPTVWSDKFPICEGTYQGYENPAAPDPDVYAEILAAMAGKTDVSTFNDTLEDIFNITFNYKDNKPYLSRTAPASLRTLLSESLVGGSFVWNQMLDVLPLNSDSTSGITYTNNNDGSFTLTGTPTGNNGFKNINYVSGYNMFTADHVYWLAIGHNTVTNVGVRFYGIQSSAVNIYVTSPRIVRADQNSGNGYARFQVTNLQGTDIGTVTLIPQVFDLTQMFGSTIADYILSLETAEQGSGVAWIQSYGFLTEDYYPYSNNTLMSVSASNHSGYGLDPIQLRGVPTLDSGNNLYYSGDVYEPNGTVTRKFGIVDIGTLSWGYSPPDGNYDYGRFSTVLSERKYGSGTMAVMGGGYTFVGNKTASAFITSLYNMSFGFQSTNRYIRLRNDSYSDVDTFKTAMTGVYLVYELATPTTETAEPFAAIQTVPETEYYTDNRTVPIPVGHESTYLVATPETPTADGTYTLTCTVTDGIPSYEWQGSAAQTLNAVRPALNLGAVQPVDINTETESAEEGDEE